MRIIVSGGLGNQMFQYALYLALKEKGRNVKLDTSLYSHVEMHNGYELDRCFNVNDALVKYSKVHLFFLRVILKIKPSIFLYEDNLQYNNGVYTTKCRYLSGSWQSEKYFIQIEDIIRKSFIFKDIDKRNLSITEEIKSYNSVSLHIRRGDYLGNSIYTGVCTEEYYLEAIEKLLSRIKLKNRIHFYIFSDDKSYANQFIGKLNYPAHLIDFNKGSDSFKDMYLMSQCKHNIIANSSFSWWGAWLNNNPDKIVIAPKHWFNVKNVDLYKDFEKELMRSKIFFRSSLCVCI